MGGSCCNRRVVTKNGKKMFIKEIDKKIEGIDNGFKKFYYEIQHMRRYKNTGLFPQILSIEDDGDMYSVAMEYYYNGATLSDLIRNKCVPKQYFDNSFDYIMDELFKRMYCHRFDVTVPSDYLNICYFNRLQHRIQRIEEDNLVLRYNFTNCLLKIIKNGCIINDEYYPPLSNYIDFMRDDNTLCREVNISYAGQAHYDLCPLNILVDIDESFPRIKNFKLIDVRGEGDTGVNIRSYMYDMGKMLLGLDAFDLFRIFNGKRGEESYEYSIFDSNIPQIKLKFIPNTIAERYKQAYEHFWSRMDEKSYYSNVLGENPTKLKNQFLFSQSMMYHPDVPCRIIYEKDETLAILMYVRGMVLIRHFCEVFYGNDPIGKFKTKVDIWKGLK